MPALRNTFRLTLALLVSFQFLAGCERKMLHGVEEIRLPRTASRNESEIKFKSADGTELAGTMTLPAGGVVKDVPAVLLLPGSGPTDRDGNQPGFTTNLLRDLAWGLADNGIASFRFDKRAVATNASKWPKDPDQIGEFFSWSRHIEDAEAAFWAMTQAGGTDEKRLGIVGHSEGGLITIELANRVKPAALGLLATPGRKFGDVVAWQLERSFKRSGLSESFSRQLLADNERIMAEIKKSGTTPSDIPPALAALYNRSVGRYMQQLADLDPVTAAARYSGPVVLIQGEMDIQVDPKLDAEPLFNALKKRGKAEMFLLPLASHNLKPVEKATDLGIVGPVVPDAIDHLATFLREEFGLEPIKDERL
ncbi:MAG: alpha/beta hydrolase [Fimbriimonadaceae bacterium]|nr:alpha/beta hydrolase [Fimbriimonadaceae bacterium]QYK58687.1 MAG: alpha/beta hydrolase [Fimbriimonadaceae bacterium]